MSYENVSPATPARTVTARAVVFGALMSVVMATLQCYLSTVLNIHFFGGIHMPFGSIFLLMLLILGFNWPVRALMGKVKGSRFALSAGELLTIYAMSLFAALISTPGCDNFVLTIGAGLFYFSKPENGWANTFYDHVPTWFAPGWDGHRYQRDVIERLYNGGLTFDQIPWHAWTVMLMAWGIFLLLTYAMLFFTALILRRQWLVNEALAFPLVQLPLQMVDTDGPGGVPPARIFWSDRTMWVGFGVAAFVHFFKGMNSVWIDWPIFPVNTSGGVRLAFTEAPLNVAGDFNANLYLGAIGVAYLLTREISFSFWFFFLAIKMEKVMAEVMGFAVASQPRDAITGQPVFIAFQAIGGWLGMAILLVWTGREHFGGLIRSAFTFGKSETTTHYESTEPFSPRFMVFGFVLCLAGLIGWSVFAGINALYAFVFFGIYLVASLVLSRIVIEGGFLFPQVPFSATDWMTTAMFSTKMVGADNLTKFAFMQPALMSDMRTNVLPAFLHTMKIAEDLKFGRRGVRRLMLASALSIVIALVTTAIVSIWALYSKGGLAVYSWFSVGGPQTMMQSTAQTISNQPGFDVTRLSWIGVGAGFVLLLTFARSRLLWFPLHPLGYIMASGYPITQLWFAFFAGWLVKTLILRFGGNDTNVKVRPFMIGLIFGNIAAMVFWMLVGFKTGSPAQYWPA